MKVNALLKPIKLGKYELPNRTFMAPLTRCRADNEAKAATELIAEYYAQRASAGLIISEGSPISPQAIGCINVPCIYSKKQIDGWKLVTEAVHKNDGRIFCQLWHPGRISHPDFLDGDIPVAPSAINPNDSVFTYEGFKETVTPRALTTAEIHDITLDFAKAAENAVKAGFDGVEIHAANGYLFHQFFTNCSNTRGDEYGGSHENKARFFFETLAAIGSAVGFERVGVRLNPSFHSFFGIVIDRETIPTFEYVAKRLNGYSNLAYVHFTEPYMSVDNIPYAVKEIAKHFSAIYQGTMIINSGFRSESGNRVIIEGYADAVSFGKPYISNPDLVERIAKNAEWTLWDEATFYTTGPEGYTDYSKLAD
jgi:N-ethylmaleimide reductase